MWYMSEFKTPVDNLQKLTIEAYEKSCLISGTICHKRVAWWTHELERFKKAASKLWSHQVKLWRWRDSVQKYTRRYLRITKRSITGTEGGHTLSAFETITYVHCPGIYTEAYADINAILMRGKFFNTFY